MKKQKIGTTERANDILKRIQQEREQYKEQGLGTQYDNAEERIEAVKEVKPPVKKVADYLDDLALKKLEEKIKEEPTKQKKK